MKDQFEKKIQEVLNLFAAYSENEESLFSPDLKDAYRNIKTANGYTIKIVQENYARGEYKSNIWMFIRDVTKSLDFIKSNFSSRKNVYKNAEACSKILCDEMNFFMKSNGYCCGIWQTRKAKSVSCSSSSKNRHPKCKINDKSIYYRYEDCVYCEHCFSMFNEVVQINEDFQPKKSDFKQYQHIEEIDENFVKCALCQRKFHERCVLHIENSGFNFYCDNCRRYSASSVPRQQYRLTADDIPTTECDEYVINYLLSSGLQMSKKIVVRLVSNFEKKFNVKKCIQKFRNETEITYNNCALFAFFKTSDGRDICFFAVYFQLYGNDCEALANRNAVYLSYIDSINLFNVPERTRYYQQIIIGLLAYLKMKGFAKIFLWSCPPKKSVDYIFHVKPKNMKIPTASRLITWYKNLFISAKEAGVVQSYGGCDQYARENNWADMRNIPYFDGDLWPIRIQEAVQITELRKASHKTIVDEVWKLMQVQTEGFDEKYFIGILNEETNSATLPHLINCKFVGSRSDLFDFFWDRKLEFSDERLAAYSTLTLLELIKKDMLDDSDFNFEYNDVNSTMEFHLQTCTEQFKRLNFSRPRMLAIDNALRNKDDWTITFQGNDVFQMESNESEDIPTWNFKRRCRKYSLSDISDDMDVPFNNEECETQITNRTPIVIGLEPIAKRSLMVSNSSSYRRHTEKNMKRRFTSLEEVEGNEIGDVPTTASATVLISDSEKESQKKKHTNMIKIEPRNNEEDVLLPLLVDLTKKRYFETIELDDKGDIRVIPNEPVAFISID